MFDLFQLPMPVNIRVLALRAKQDGGCTLYRLEHGAVLQFRLGPTLLGCSIDLWTNHPENEGEEFQREKYRKLEWQFDSSNRQDATAAYVDLQLVKSGSFRFYFTCPDEDVGGDGYFLVDPVLHSGPDDKRVRLPLDSIQCQTVLAKNLGELSGWEDKLRVAKETGYNMLHFTPVQVKSKQQY